MEWSAPPSRPAPVGKFSAVRAELRTRPGEWGVVATERKSPLGTGTKTCWIGFELRHVSDPETHLYTIYGRYLEGPVSSPEFDVALVAAALHADAHPETSRDYCLCTVAAGIAVEVLTPVVEARTKDLGWVPFGYHAIFSPVPPLVFSEMEDPDGLPRWERLNLDLLDAYLEREPTFAWAESFADTQEALKAERDAWKVEAVHHSTRNRELSAERDALRAQLERDRKALADPGPQRLDVAPPEYDYIEKSDKRLDARFSVRLSYEELQAAENARHEGETISSYLRRLIKEDSHEI